MRQSTTYTWTGFDKAKILKSPCRFVSSVFNMSQIVLDRKLLYRHWDVFSCAIDQSTTQLEVPHNPQTKHLITSANSLTLWRCHSQSYKHLCGQPQSQGVVLGTSAASKNEEPGSTRLFNRPESNVVGFICYSVIRRPSNPTHNFWISFSSFLKIVWGKDSKPCR